MSTSLALPTRHGTHLPHDSLRKNRTLLRAMSSMQVPSAHTTMAPEPSIEPAFCSEAKSSETPVVDAGARDVAADPDELDAGGAVCPLRLEPLHALDEDQWHGRERLDVVDDRRLLPQPVRPGKRRLVPRLRALVLDGLEQRRLLAADVPARADEHAHVEGQVRAEDAPTEQAVATAGSQLALEMFGQRLVLVAYIDDALVGADDEAGQNHALDHQMRHVIEDEAVLDGPRLALVGIAHDVLRRPGR